MLAARLLLAAAKSVRIADRAPLNRYLKNKQTNKCIHGWVKLHSRGHTERGIRVLCCGVGGVGGGSGGVLEEEVGSPNASEHLAGQSVPAPRLCSAPAARSQPSSRRGSRTDRRRERKKKKKKKKLLRRRWHIHTTPTGTGVVFSRQSPFEFPNTFL